MSYCFAGIPHVPPPPLNKLVPERRRAEIAASGQVAPPAC